MTVSGLQHAWLLDGKGGATRLEGDAVAAWKPDDGILWMNLDYSERDAYAWLEANLDPLVREALLDVDPRPRAIARGDELMLIVRGINLNQGAAPEDMISIRSWIGPRRIITLRHRISSSLKEIAGDLATATGPRDAGDFAAALLEHVVEHVVTRVDKLGDAVAAAEEKVLGDLRGDLRAQLADERRRAIALRRFLAPQREALTKLGAVQLPWLTADHRTRFAESADRLTRSIEELDAARDRAAVTQEELQSRVAEIANQRLYFLSLITAVFLPLGFLCALLQVPLDHDGVGFWLLCAACAVGGLAQIYLFKKRGWL